MSKKFTLLALAAISAAMFALPAVASAEEWHIDVPVGTTISGTIGAGSLAAVSEPTITCESGHVKEGSFDPGGTTGKMTLDFTGCHSSLGGFTIKCRTTGSALDNTIQTKGTFHLITVNNVPAILVTPETTTIVCAGISSVVVHGAVIGTFVKPPCGTETKTLTTSFEAVGTTQKDLHYTGVTYDLTATTGASGEARTAGLTSTATLETSALGKLTCT